MRRTVRVSRSLAKWIAPLTALAWGWPMAALAQPTVFQQCASVATPMTAIRFDDDQHRAWYLRFWTGSCAGTHSFCIPGSPNWMTTVSYVTEHAPPPERAALVTRTCRLGQEIGLEWSRSPRIKRISANDLRLFSDILRHTPDLNAALNQIGAKVAALIAGKR